MKIFQISAFCFLLSALALCAGPPLILTNWPNHTPRQEQEVRDAQESWQRFYWTTLHTPRGATLALTNAALIALHRGITNGATATNFATQVRAALKEQRKK